MHLASPIFAVIVVLCAGAGPFAGSAPSSIPTWLKKHVGEGEDRIEGMVFERARALYFRKTAEGEIRNPCYFAMDATRDVIPKCPSCGKADATRSEGQLMAQHRRNRPVRSSADCDIVPADAISASYRS
ncbi:hypothetical protein HYPP_03468 [Hyphomicrobium sp. ghe19]|nr:hypothetical protein HYPP_03468 [Hyphomicrobium sp. ghe19]